MTETSLVRADLLLALENAGAVTTTELRLPVGISLERYEAVGAMLGQLTSAARFWVGDWLLHGEECFGSLAPQLSEALNLSPEARAEYLRVALAIPPSYRRTGLSWSHHRVVAARWVTPELSERLLDRAERDGLSNRELEAQARAIRERLDAPEPGTHEVARGRSTVPVTVPASLHVKATDCEQLVQEALADLRLDLLDCGFGDALTVTVEVSAASVAYRVSIGPEEVAA